MGLSMRSINYSFHIIKQPKIMNTTSTMIRIVCVLLVAWCLGAGCHKTNAHGSGSSAETDSVLFGRQAYVVEINGNFLLLDTFLVTVGGVLDTLAQPGPYTSFLGDNNALNATGWGYAQTGMIYYVQLPPGAQSTFFALEVSGAHELRALPVARNQQMTSLQGAPLFINKYALPGDTTVTVNG